MLSGITEVLLAGPVLPSSNPQELHSEERVAWKPALGFLEGLFTPTIASRVSTKQ